MKTSIADELKPQFNLLLRRLAEWIDGHQDAIDSAFLTMRDRQFRFLAISKEPTYDDRLTDSISDLDFEIANDRNLKSLNLDTLILPPASRQAIDPFLEADVVWCLRETGKTFHTTIS